MLSASSRKNPLLVRVLIVTPIICYFLYTILPLSKLVDAAPILLITATLNCTQCITMSLIHSFASYYMTSREYHRTQTDYNNALGLKVGAVQRDTQINNCLDAVMYDSKVHEKKIDTIVQCAACRMQKFMGLTPLIWVKFC